MDREIINYYGRDNIEPVEVRLLLFNESFNIYETESDNLITSFPIKGATVVKSATKYSVYSPDKGVHFQLNSSSPLTFQIANEIENSRRTGLGKLVRHRAFALLAICLALFIGFYFAIISLVPYLGLKMIDEAAEIKIGRNLRELMRQQEAAMGVEVDSAGTRRLQQFTAALQLSSRYPIRVTLVKSSTVNAYALPGGEIVIYTGILHKMESYKSLVALLAHESSHVNERHTLRSLLRSTANSIVISVFLGDVTAASGVIAGNIENFNGLQYSRSLEREADNEGMKLLLANKIDVNGMKELMRLLKAEGDMSGSMAFVSTHPPTSEREKAVDDFIQSHENNPGERQDLETIFQAILLSR